MPSLRTAMIKRQNYIILNIAKSNNKIKKNTEHYKERDRESTYIHSVEQLLTLLVNDEKLKDLTNVAKAFNNFFITITEKLNTQQTAKGDAISILKDSFPGNFSSRKIIPVT